MPFCTRLGHLPLESVARISESETRTLAGPQPVAVSCPGDLPTWALRVAVPGAMCGSEGMEPRAVGHGRRRASLPQCLGLVMCRRSLLVAGVGARVRE